MRRFRDRGEAGALLGRMLLDGPQSGENPVILGLVRGGADVAAALAAETGAAWDVFVVRKIGAPDQPEYALGALAETGHYLLNQPVIDQLKLGLPWVETALRRARTECAELAEMLRGSARLPELAGRHVLITDDGVATGFTMRAAVNAVEASGAASVRVVVPVIAPDTLSDFREEGIDCMSLIAPRGFRAVGQYYADFAQVTTADVQRLLAARAG